MSNKIGVKCVFGHSLSLSQHIDVEQDWDKMCFRALSKSLAAQRCPTRLG